MNKIKILLSAFFIFSLGFALIACEEEKTEKTEKNEESAFKFGTVEIPVSDGTLCIAPFFVAKEKGFFAKEGVDVKFVSANAETRKIGLNNGTYPITNSDFAFFQSVENGVNIKVVQQLMRHENIKMTLDIYGHILDTDAEKAIEKAFP